MNFIFVSLQRINTDRESTSTSIAKELAKSHRVLYVNPPIDRKTWLFSTNEPFISEHIRNIKNKKSPLIKSDEYLNLWILSPNNIIESVNWIPNTRIFSLFNKINNKTFSREIKKALEQLGFNDFTLIIDKDIFRSYYLKELLKPQHTIYLDRDYTLGFDYWKRHGVSLEPRLISKCDAVVCNSTDFANSNKAYNSNSYYIGNGANLTIFDVQKPQTQPAELIALDRPLIGYVGALTSSRLDISLLSRLAENLHAGTLVLIGPQDQDFLRSELHLMKNVRFISQKDTRTIPSYLSFFDVCINPQLLNKITMGNFPLKIIEYLSMGKPVVATATNTMKEIFNNHAYLASSPAEFIRQIYVALDENTMDRTNERVRFSKNYSWENVTRNLLDVILKLDANVNFKNHPTKTIV